MAEFLKSLVFEVNWATARIDSATPDRARVSAQNDAEMIALSMSRRALEKLGRDILSELKRVPPPTRRQKNGSSSGDGPRKTHG